MPGHPSQGWFWEQAAFTVDQDQDQAPVTARLTGVWWHWSCGGAQSSAFLPNGAEVICLSYIRWESYM